MDKGGVEPVDELERHRQGARIPRDMPQPVDGIEAEVLVVLRYPVGGVVADETAKDAHTAHVQVYHDAAHASTIQLPLR